MKTTEIMRNRIREQTVDFKYANDYDRAVRMLLDDFDILLNTQQQQLEQANYYKGQWEECSSMVKDAERETKRLYEVLKKIAEYTPPNAPEIDPYINMAIYAKRLAKEAISTPDVTVVGSGPDGSDLDFRGLLHPFGGGKDP